MAARFRPISRPERILQLLAREITMGMLDDVVGSAVPKGSLAKPLMIALMALLASGALTRKNVTAGAAPAQPQAPPGEGDGGLLGGLGGLLNRFQQNGL